MVEPIAGKINHLKVVKTPGKVVKRGGASPRRGAIAVIKGIKRKGEADKKQVAFFVPVKRRRRNSEVPCEVDVGNKEVVSSRINLRRTGV